MTLVAEPNAQGHRLYYVSLLIEECRSRGDRVILLTTKSAAESPQWKVHLSELDPEVLLQQPDRFSLLDIASVSSELGAGLTIVPDADGHLLPTLRSGWTGPGQLNILIMRPDGQVKGAFRWIRPMKSITKWALIWVADLRPRVHVLALRSPLLPRRGLRWIADPVELKGSAQQSRAMRENLGIDSSRYWLGVFGEISPRKNLPMVLEAILDQPATGLLIVGSISPEVSVAIAPLMAEFSANGGKVCHLDGHLSETEFDSAIGTVDCVIVAHSNEGSSGVLLKAAVSGKRLLLAGAKSLRQDAATLGHQATWSALHVDDLRRTIEQVRRLPEPNTTVDLGTDEFLREMTSTR